MTTERTSWALAREAVGLVLTAFGVLGVLVALGQVHWSAALAAIAVLFILAGVFLRPDPSFPRWTHMLRGVLGVTGYLGLIVCAFNLSVPLGWIAVFTGVGIVGLLMASPRDTAPESGAADQGEGAA
ncbi:hypothetical protein [Streptomyces sp. BK022]|uniref:hypothetical protein n=1 Tax=Streptomyces sp. BK022 TaxID=2512123 RepID=UPI00102A4355|nr:hypothetical protein [Streptomyces sp. BK022]